MENLKYKRIVIIGGPGSGKSTLSERISLYTNLPVYHLDKLLLDTKWKIKDKNEWGELCKIFLQKDCGIVDGNYSSILPERIKWADLVIFLNISTKARLYLILKRFIGVRLGFDKNYGMPEGAKEKISLHFLVWSYGWNRRHKQKTLHMLESLEDKKVIVTNSPRDLDLREIF